MFDYLLSEARYLLKCERYKYAALKILPATINKNNL